MSLVTLLAAILILALPAAPAAAAKRALFDNFHAEQAGNADWVIDDQQPTPVPAQGAIVQSTPRTYWLGAISSWGVDLVKRGFTVTTNNAAFTYGNAGNPLDLANFDVLIVPEPNTLFSAGEASAILAFVHDGGGLIAVGDHDISDRNGDGIDSPKAWNAMDPTHLLGVHWASTGEPLSLNNIVQTSANLNPALSDSITHGAVGVAPGLAFHNGTTFAIFPADNPSVRGEVWMTGLAQTSTTGIMAASSQYGSGRVFFLGDSSPIDDGSATPGNNNIFDGWAEVADSVLVMNATLWASRRAAPAGDVTAPALTLNSPNGGEDWKAGSSHAVTWTATDAVGVTGVDLAWSGDGGASYPNPIAAGLANSGSFTWQVPDLVSGTVRVRATARDAANNSAGDASNANFAISRWLITAAADSNGSVSPSGTTGVAEHGSLSVSIAAAPLYGITGVLADGVSVGVVGSYTFTDVTANHTLAASFADLSAPNVALGSPLGGEGWDVSTLHAVTWTASDNIAVDSVNVDYSLHGAGGPWLPVAHQLANSGTYDWTLPTTATDSARVRVVAFDGAGNSASASSTNEFRITALALGVPGDRAVLALSRPAPNPAHGGTTLHFSLPAAGRVRVEVVDVAGRRVWEHSETLASGSHAWLWDGRDSSGRTLEAGLYLVRLVTPWGTRGARLAWVR
jgi:hypothetical protein